MKNFTLIALFALVLSGCTSFGTKLDFNGDELYYKTPVTEETAKSVGEFLVGYKYFTGQGYSVQVTNDSGMHVRFVTQDGIENDPETIGGFKFLLIDLVQSALKGTPADIDLCDDQLKTKSTITYDDAKMYMQQMMDSQQQ